MSAAEPQHRNPQGPARETRRRWPMLIVAAIVIALVGGVVGFLAALFGQGSLGQSGVGTPDDPAAISIESPSGRRRTRGVPGGKALPPGQEEPPPGQEAPEPGGGSRFLLKGSDPGQTAKPPVATKPPTKWPSVIVSPGGVKLPTSISVKPGVTLIPLSADPGPTRPGPTKTRPPRRRRPQLPPGSSR